MANFSTSWDIEATGDLLANSSASFRFDAAHITKGEGRPLFGFRFDGNPMGAAVIMMT